MRPRERMAARKARADPQDLRARHDAPLYGSDIRHQRAGFEVRHDGIELCEVGGRRRGEDQQISHAGDIGGARRRIVERALLRRQRAFGRLGRPADDGRHARQLALSRQRAADRTEADDPEMGRFHAAQT
jgi:hypothetical protein